MGDTQYMVNVLNLLMTSMLYGRNISLRILVFQASTSESLECFFEYTKGGMKKRFHNSSPSENGKAYICD